MFKIPGHKIIGLCGLGTFQKDIVVRVNARFYALGRAHPNSLLADRLKRFRDDKLVGNCDSARLRSVQAGKEKSGGNDCVRPQRENDRIQSIGRKPAMRPKEFVSSIQELKFENVFNPYSDRCSVYDVSDAPSRRAQALLELLEAAVETEVDAFWIGRDLGHRGGRRTGLALTDDVHLAVHATRWNISFERATTGALIAERTAAVIWRMLTLVPATVFLWNVFPFHPHEPHDPFSNRSHRPHERAVGEALLEELIVMLRPRRLVAIGNDAAKTASRIGGMTGVMQVRHPSYGGQSEFVYQIRELYGLKADAEQLALM